MPRTFVVDSGGTSRFVRRILVVDSGGTTRLVRRAFVVDAGGVSRLFFSGATVSLGGSFVSDATIAPVNPIARYILNSNGLRQSEVSGGIVTSLGAWVDPTTAAGDYESRATLISGTFTSSTFGVWRPMTSSYSWGITRSSNGTSNASMTLEIREAVSLTVVGSATISFQATRDP